MSAFGKYVLTSAISLKLTNFKFVSFRNFLNQSDLIVFSLSEINFLSACLLSTLKISFGPPVGIIFPDFKDC